MAEQQPPDAWVEVNYQVVIHEERTVRLPIRNEDITVMNQDELLKVCDQVALVNRAEVLSNKEKLKITNINTKVPRLIKLYFTDEEGKPDVNSVVNFND